MLKIHLIKWVSLPFLCKWMDKQKAWEELTGRAYTQKNNIAIVLDNIVYSAPGVSTGPFQEEDQKFQDLLT
jgi:hypothetical protein